MTVVRVKIKTRRNVAGPGFASIEKTITSNVAAMSYNYAQRVESGAKRRVHVITGNLRDSIHRVRDATGKHTVVVGAHYGIYEEYGTRYRPPHPYFRPAVRDAQVLFKKDLARAFKQGGVTQG